MSFIDDIRERFDRMDPVQRQNFWFAVAGLIVVILLIMSLRNTYDAIAGFLGLGRNVTEHVISGVSNLTGATIP